MRITMKKSLLKLLLLITAVWLSLYGVLHWKHTIVDPPQKLVFANCHDRNLVNSISMIDDDSLETEYFECQYKLRRYRNEQLIGSSKADSRMEEFLNVYIPKFVHKSNNAFDNSRWDIAPWNHSFMRNRISELKQLKKQDGTDLIEASSEYMNQMNSILSVIEKYNAAWQLARRTGFRSVATTKERVAQANEYKNDIKLKKCEALFAALDELPVKIKINHLWYLTNLSEGLFCDSLRDYREYFAKFQDFFNKCNEYEVYYWNYDSEKDTEDLKNACIQRQYGYLKEYVDNALDVDNYKDYSQYQTANRLIKAILDKYSAWLKNHNIDANIQNLLDLYDNPERSKYIRSREEFNEKQRPYLNTAPKFA